MDNLKNDTAKQGARQMPSSTVKVVTGSDKLQKGAATPKKGGNRN